jgi:phage gp29-like protein
VRLFQRKKQHKRDEEWAPQLSAWQRQAMELPGVPPGGLSYAVYDQMQSDAMIQTALSVKRLGVLAAPYHIEPFDGSVRATEVAGFVSEALNRMHGSAHSILNAAMDAFAKGWSIQEIIWKAADGRWWIESCKPKDPSYFGVEVDAYGKMVSLTVEVPGEGSLKMPPEKFVIFAHRPSYGKPKGTSDLDAAFPHWRSKRELIGAWQAHLQRFASPTLVRKVRRGAPPSERDALLGILKRVQDHQAMVMADDNAIETVSAGRDAQNAFLDAIDYHNREIARAILGQTLTTDEGRRVGSMALGKVHLHVLMLQLESLRSQLADEVMTEQVIRPLVEANFGRVPLPRFLFETSPSTAFLNGEM